MKKRFASLTLLCVLLLTGACGPWTQAGWLAQQDRDIEKATKAIETARDDGERARGHSERGRGYSEKSRYSRVFKLITADEYGRLFDLAIGDHDRAAALAPRSAEVYLDRGLTYYDRAALEDRADPKANALFGSAEADFTRTIERDGRNARAFDMRGIVHTACGDLDQAIADFAREMTIEPRLGRLRLAEAYCDRGSFHQKAKSYDRAISDYTKAIELGIPSDGCSCQPESPLAWIYCETKQYDKSWEVVRRARKSNRWIAPELIEQLRKASGRGM